MSDLTVLGLTPEEQAAGAIRRCLDSAVVPNLHQIADDTGLTRAAVERIRDAILSGKREHKTLGRPTAAAPITPGGAAAPLGGPAENPDLALIAATLGHDSPKVRRLAKRAHDTSVRLGLLVDEIRAAVDAHAAAQVEAAKRAARIKKLEAELATLKGHHPKRATPTAPQACDCGWTGQKPAQHRAMAHKGES